MQISDLVKPISQLSDEELYARIRQVRHRREVARPVAKAKAARAEKKDTQAKSTKINTLVKGMSPEDIAKLIAALQQ